MLELLASQPRVGVEASEQVAECRRGGGAIPSHGYDDVWRHSGVPSPQRLCVWAARTSFLIASVGALMEPRRGLLAMASPQLQQVIDSIKALSGMASGASVAELRETNEQMARPTEPDVKSEPVDANGVGAVWISAPGAAEDRVVLYLHGGGYIMGSPNTHRDLMGRIARTAQARVLGLDYRLAPEHPFPAAVDDTPRGLPVLARTGASA